MRASVIACASISLIILSQISVLCHGEPVSISVEADKNSVNISETGFQFISTGRCHITLDGTWYYDNTKKDPQTYVISYYCHGNSSSRRSEILVVGEEYDWIIEDNSSLYLYFPDPGDISDNGGKITIHCEYLDRYLYAWNRHQYIEVSASENSVSIAHADSYVFPSGGEYELEISGSWSYNDNPQNYTLVYYSGSDWSEILVERFHYVWSVSQGARVYFYTPFLGGDRPDGLIVIVINPLEDPTTGQMWCLTPVWIGIWLTIIGIIIGLIGLAVHKRR